MGDWLRNEMDKDKGGRPVTGCIVQPVSEPADTYTTLGIEKTDAFRLQRFWDWEKETSGATKAVTELQETGKEIVVSKLLASSGERLPLPLSL
jgi:hypothetical protein